MSNARDFLRHEARSRRGAAVHEAGHVVVSHLLGFQSWGHIEPLHAPPLKGIWTGRAPHIGLPSLRDQRLIGVAGAVAEYCWEGGDIAHGHPHDIDTLFEDGAVSDGDRTISHLNRRNASIKRRVFDLDNSTWSEREKWQNAINRAYKLLNRDNGKLWSDLLREARALIVSSRKPLERAA
jgi:hypothetical protein